MSFAGWLSHVDLTALKIARSRRQSLPQQQMSPRRQANLNSREMAGIRTLNNDVFINELFCSPSSGHKQRIS
jgi:hypothetical protein